MDKQEQKIKDSEGKEIDVEGIIESEKKDEDEDLTTLFAVRTTINQESNVLKQIFYRFKILDTIPDIKAMLVSPLLPGYVFLEASQKRDVQVAIQGISHIKGRIVGQIKLDEIKHVLIPRSVTEFLEVGDKVEIISGVFEGSKAKILRMPHDSSTSEEVVVRLLQEETPITIKIHGDYLKLIEKKKEKKEEKKEEIPEIQSKMAEEEVSTDLDQFSFEDEIETDFEDDYVEYEDETYEYTDDEDEFDEDDEWAKFDGF
ncbi:MAG: transcription elongation factor Spt5 [Promethearchaeia archaeon]